MTHSELLDAAAKLPAAPPELSAAEIGARGQALYDSQIRPLVEDAANTGRLVSVDILSGDYELSDDTHHLNAIFSLRARQPDAVIYTLRIGYAAVSSRNGRVQRQAS